MRATTLTDAEATKANIIAALKDIAGAVTPDDVVVIFLAGHGRTVDGHYYFAPSDMGRHDPALMAAIGVPPEAICAVTFTNKAAEEMRERVAHLLHDKKTARALTIGTFHALGLHILKSERRALGMPRGFAIYDQADHKCRNVSRGSPKASLLCVKRDCR